MMSGDRQRPTTREQIEEILLRARDRQEPFRIRLPFNVYSHDASRTYITLRDTAWNISLPATSPEGVEEFIDILGECIKVIVTEGTAVMRAKLAGRP